MADNVSDDIFVGEEATPEAGAQPVKRSAPDNVDSHPSEAAKRPSKVTVAGDVSAGEIRTTRESSVQINGLFDTSDNHTRTGPPAAYQLYASAAGRRGQRDEMQDAHTIVHDLWACADPATKSASEKLGEKPRLAYFGVFDGHAGARAAEYAAEHLHVRFLAGLVAYMAMVDQGLVPAITAKEVKRCLTDAFKQTDSDFLALAAKERWKDGCTACVVLIYNDDVYVAYIGDSGAALGSREKDAGPAPYSDHTNIKAIKLTKEHNPTVYDERVRIQKAGGTVKDGRVLGILEVSRSIGDGSFKHLGVICTPDIVSAALTGRERFVIIACDGLWNNLPSKDAVAFVADYLESESAKSGAEAILDQQDLQEREATTDEERAARRQMRALQLRRMLVQSVTKALVNEAVKRGSTDNVSAIVVAIGKDS